MVAITEHTLNEITRRIVAAVAPERVYLFGSRAEGSPRPNSDIDLVVVMSDDCSDRSDLSRRVFQAIGSAGCGLDVLVYYATNFDRRSGWRANFEHTVRNQGRLLYGDDSMEFTREWFAKGIRDLEAARSLVQFKPELPDIAAFHFQQACEMVLKAFLVEKNEPFERIHDLGAICDLCQKFDAAFAVLREDLASLNQYAVKLRYPGEGDVAPEELARVYDITASVMRFVRDRLPSAIGTEFDSFLE